MNVTRGVTLMVLLSLIAGVRLAAAEQVIFLVRHAERADAAATPAPARPERTRCSATIRR